MGIITESQNDDLSKMKFCNQTQQINHNYKIHMQFTYLKKINKNCV